MADHVSSKSKKRRTKNQRKKLKKANEKLKEDSTENYAVDFPETATSKVKIKVKSKSLDDDEDSVKIQEVTECCEGERQECEAIISEADSDWEEANTLKLPQEPVALSTIAITIDEEPLQRLEGFSPEEELSLRNFLETINLVNAPETPVTTSTLDTIKKEKSRKRDALIKYFKPLVHNPRYLDIISEESSDLSDRETPSLTQHLKQGTPELEYPIKSSPKVIRRRKQGQARNEEKAVLVCTKLVETPSIVEHFHSCATENIEAEKVFLDTSSEYTSSKNSSDSEESNDEVKNVNDLSLDVANCNIEVTNPCEPENDNVITVVTHQNEYNELTPPPTPDLSPKGKSSDSNINLEECMKDIAIDTAKEISMVLCKLTQHDASPPEKPNLQSVFLQSPCSSSSTSRETSPSTVRLKTLNTSIADVASILTDLELAKEVSTFKQPLELRQMCLNFLLSLPCGAEILQELSDLALNLDKLTQMLNPSKKLLKNARLSSDFELNNSESIPEKHMWSGQNRKSFHTSEDMKNEPDILFDLHTKFLERENSSLLEKQFRKSIEITSIQTETMENRSDITYSVTSSKTLPKNFKHSPNNARLSASNLDEWLNFAREDKNMPEINAKEEDNKELRNRFKHEEMKVPNELYHRQMQLILEKEREIQKELEQLLEEKRKLCLEIEGSDIEAQNKKTRPKSFPPAISESFRQQMFEEYKKQIEEREDRKHNKVIKITSSPGIKSEEGEKPKVEVTHVTGIEDEFMKKVQELHGIPSEIEEEETLVEKNEECEPVLLIDGNRLKESTTDLPKHLREFVEITSNSSVSDSTEGVWSPGQKQEFTSADIKNHERQEKYEALPSVWQPKSATSSPVAERKEFRPVNFESPKLGRKNRSEEVLNNSEKSTPKLLCQEPASSSDTGIHLSSTPQKHLPNTRPTPAADFNALTTTPRLPKAQNPTVTLLQKAREGQLPRGANYLEANRDHYRIPQEPGRQEDIVQPRRNDFYSESDSEISRKMVDSSRRKLDGVGPINRDGMPLSLRSEVRDGNQSKWYKKMYDTIHKQKPYKDEYVTVRYKQRRAQYPYITGYLSEPEPGAYDSDHMDHKYATLDRRRTPISEKENFATSTMPRSAPLKMSSSSDFVHHTLGSKQNPGRIENYTPGHSSISDQESKKNFVEERKPVTKGYMSQALKESGYESDSTLVFRRKEDGSRLSPSEQKEAYKIIQKGGDIPLHGLRKPAPEPRKETRFRPVSPSYPESASTYIIPQHEIFCYPVTVHPKKQDIFVNYKRSAPASTSTQSQRPPSPPRRRSSRNNTTLRLITTMKVGKEKLPVCKRHEICFTSTSDIEKSKVKYLRDKISCKLSPSKTKKSTKITVPISKASSTTISQSKVTKNKKSESCCSRESKKCKPCAARAAEAKVTKKVTPKTIGTFGTEKRKILMNLPKFFEEKKTMKSVSKLEPVKSNTEISKSVPLSPKTNRKEILQDAKVNINEGKRLIRARTPSPSYSTSMRSRTASPTKSSLIESSWESLKSPTLVRKERMLKNNSTPKKNVRSTSQSPSGEDLKKAKKEEINGKIANKKISVKHKVNTKHTATKVETLPHERKLRNKTVLPLSEVQKQHKVIHSDRFFQHLFLGDEIYSPKTVKNNSWLSERTFHRSRDRPVKPQTTAMNIYLRHTKPVTDSKFKSIDRSRSVSPKSLTFEKNYDSNSSIDKVGRSISLPPKLLFFSQTSRPVSPIVQKRHLEVHNPPESPTISRSPSQRKIDALKQIQYTHFNENLPMPSKYDTFTKKISNVLTNGESPKEFLKKISQFARRSTKFKDLNEFYLTLEKLGELERIANDNEAKIRKRSEGEIVDFERWREVHQKERTEKEINYLCNKLKEKERDEGFLFRPKDVTNYRWRRELDRGLRVREKSVENIKEEFEKLKLFDPSHKIIPVKDTYKPLWRGNSVLNLASHMVARRSQSEGRVPQSCQKFSSSEKLLTKGIGSRIWSSLSMDQVNTLKEQLTEIYNHNYSKQKTPEYNVYVPREKEPNSSHLTVRRNSDVSKPITIYREQGSNSLSETEKKRISQSLSKEVMNRISNKPTTPVAKRGKISLDTKSEKKITKLKNQRVTDPQLGKEIIISKSDQEIMSGSDISGRIKSKSSESGSTDESTKTVIFVEQKEDIKKKVDYFEKALDKEEYVPTIYKPADPEFEEEFSGNLGSSSSCQDFKELFGEREIVRMATRPLSASRKSNYTSPPLHLRTTNLSPCKLSISEGTSCDSLYRSRSLSPFLDEPETFKSGEVRRLRDKFEYVRSYYLKPRRCFSDSNLYKKSSTYLPALTNVDVDSLRRKYEYPVHAGRGRSRVRRGGVVSPLFLRAEDRFMPHINIISKIASLCSKKFDKPQSPTNEDLSELWNVKSGDVEKLKGKFDSKGNDISLLGKMFTSSPDIKELRDIAPYLTGSWTAHRFPRSTENTISLASPDESVASMDTSIVRKSSPQRASKKASILKSHTRSRSTDSSSKSVPLARSARAQSSPQPDLDDVRYRSHWTSVHSKPSVTFKEPEPPLPPPKGHHGPKEPQQGSPRKYVENQVTIHYKTPVRQEIKEYYSEDELAHRQQEAVKKMYQEERRRKYLQELQDIHNRRHTDNFIPSQKSPIPLNRYDDFDNMVAPQHKIRPRSPEPRLVARALYNFVGMTPRELTFRKGDNIYVRRQIDKNWYEGELNAMVGLFPVNYVEIVPYENVRTTPRKPHEGQARAKYNFLAKTHLELSLAKGEMVIITRRVDNNWYEGKIGGRRGIFPASYVDVLIDPQEPLKDSPKPVAAPASHSLLLNGSSGRESMGSHTYTPNLPNPEQVPAPSYFAKPVQVNYCNNYGNRNSIEQKNPMGQALHIDTQSAEPTPYKALYKYLPQNDDELELMEGDTVYVLEKCDDGWFVGSNERTGAFGTFPGNYVDKM